MKKLTKIRLINWHYFTNQTIDLNGNAVLSGKNGSGKSTILDAITFVLSAGDQNFNLAALEKGKRDLRSYVKCKLGSLDQEYLRDYDQTCHISLEFFSEKQNRFMTLGAIIEVVGNIQPPKVYFYHVASEMREEFFIDEKSEIRDFASFKKEGFTQDLYLTRKEAKSAFRTKMGGVSDKYFKLLPKALAFKPISDVKDYIYSHLLEEKQLDVDNIKDSIRTYKEFEALLKQTKNKIDDLNNIKNSYFRIKEIKENETFLNYVLSVLSKEEALQTIDKKSKAINQKEVEETQINEKLSKIEDSIEKENDRAREMYAALSSNKEFRANELFAKDIKKAEDALSLAKEKRRELERKILEYKDNLKHLQTLDKEQASILPKIRLDIDTVENINSTQLSLLQAQNAFSKIKDTLVKKQTEVTIKKNDCIVKLNDVYQSLTALSKNTVPYRSELIELRDQIEAHLSQVYGEHISVHVLSEIIEVTDESWHDTVENFLANNRFTLIVEPKYYNEALECYNNFKSNRIFGINLLNTKHIAQFSSYMPNSLASIIETENKDARCYINYLVGQLIMVDKVSELDKYPQAITKEGMLYRGFVTRYLNPNIEKPFIGKGARTQQNVKFSKLGEDLKHEFNQYQISLTHIDALIEGLESLRVEPILDLLKYAKESITLVDDLSELKGKKEHLEMTNVNDLRVEYEELKEKIRVLEQSKSATNIELGSHRQTVRALNEEVIQILNEIKIIDARITLAESSNFEFITRKDKLFSEAKAQNLSGKEISDYYQKEFSQELASLKTLETGLVYSQTQYITKYSRPFATGFDAGQSYLDELDKLIQSELVKYESKVRDARENAEKLFKEDFISKLRGYILEAQDEIAKINETLTKIKFGSDQYEFVFLKSKEYGAIYDMITDEMNMNIGYSIFDDEFERKYNQEIDELFNHLAQDELNSNGALSKYTDYRTYMDYDLKVYNDTDTFYYSNISLVKSGGETQTPFYIAILASFVRLFDKAEKNGLDDSIGLIVFDEVFEKMDEARIGSVMEFINNLNVQIMFACPPQRTKFLSQYTQTTVAVFNENKKAGCIIMSAK